jgi:hypothetical protein
VNNADGSIDLVFRDKQKARGLVQANFWVPADKLEAIKALVQDHVEGKAQASPSPDLVDALFRDTLTYDWLAGVEEIRKGLTEEGRAFEEQACGKALVIFRKLFPDQYAGVLKRSGVENYAEKLLTLGLKLSKSETQGEATQPKPEQKPDEKLASSEEATQPETQVEPITVKPATKRKAKGPQPLTTAEWLKRRGP